MSNDIANITVTGRLGGDPEVKEKFSTFTVASNYWDGKEEKTSWRRVKDFRKGFDTRAGYMAKGSKVTISGAESVEEWTDKEGNKRTSVVIAADSIVFPAKSDSSKSPAAAPQTFDESADIPF